MSVRKTSLSTSRLYTFMLDSDHSFTSLNIKIKYSYNSEFTVELQ